MLVRPRVRSQLCRRHPLGCAVSSFPTPKDEGGITGVPEGGGSAVDECGPAVTSGHFNPTLT